MEWRHDQTLLKILRDENNVTNFLDATFGFLYRCTDFYVDVTAQRRSGFPLDLAEKLVVSSFRKWRTGSSSSLVDPTKGVQDSEAIGPTREEDIELNEKSEKDYIPPLQFSDSYNGAVREKYTWSQSISDLDVFVKLPTFVKTIADLKVNISAKEIKIAARTDVSTGKNLENPDSENSESSGWMSVFRGELTFRIKREESVWSMVPEQYVNIHLEKCSERWWEALIVGEPNIELSKIDCSRHLDELDASEQMKIQELMWNHQQKLLGKASSDKNKVERILEKAWNVEGSPSKGTVYDPSILNFN